MRLRGNIVSRVMLISVVMYFGSRQEVKGQATFQTTGLWSTALNWSGSNIGDLLSENVTINSLQGATISTGLNYTIGHLTFANTSSLSINGTGVLNVGSAGNPRNLTANNGATITVFGSLIVWGNMVVNSDLTLIVTGTLTVRGNLQMASNAVLGVTGNMNILGSFTAADNARVAIVPGGHINVGGTVTVGQNGLLLGLPGSFHTHGACTQGSGSLFCNTGILPVHLVSFGAEPEETQVRVTWHTASELNSDYFEILKSQDGESFQPIGKVSAQGMSSARVEYEFIDENPFAGSSYYQLKAVDVDDYTEYFNIVHVRREEAKTFSIHPNPSSGAVITSQLNFAPEENTWMVIRDLTGHEHVRMQVTASRQEFTLATALNTGTYYATLTTGEIFSVFRLVVR